MLKTLAKSIRQYKRESILSPVLVTLEVLLECMIPLYMSTMLKDITDEPTMSNILIYGAILLVMAAFSLLFGILAGKYAATASAGFARNLRHDIYYKIQDFSFANIDKFSTNSLVTRMTTDVVNVQNAFMMTLRVTVKSPVSLICALFMAFSINWKIGLLYVVVIPVLFIALMIIAKLTHPIFQRIFRTYDRLNGIVREDIHGIRVVKSFVREEYETKKFENVSETIREDFTKAEKLIAFNPFLMQMAIYTCMVVISWFSASAIVESGNGSMVSGISMTTGELQNLLTCSMMILMSLMMLSMIYV